MNSGSKIFSNILTARTAQIKNATDLSSPQTSPAVVPTDTAVLVMAESAGLFSSRLGSPQNATAVASAMLRRVLSVASRSNVGDVHLAWRGFQPPDHHAIAAGRSGRFSADDLNGGWHFQQGQDFAQRLHTSVARLFASGYKQVIVLSSDTPGISAKLIGQARNALNSSPLVIGPDTRGGCYLLALTPQTLPLLGRIQWQQNRDAAQLASLRPDAAILQNLLTDIDAPEHLSLALSQAAASLAKLVDHLLASVFPAVGAFFEQVLFLKCIHIPRLAWQLPPPQTA